MSCEILIKRESRLAGSMRKLQIYLDGRYISSVGNGSITAIPTQSGKHKISFAIGKKIMTDIDLSIDDFNSRIDVICWIDTSFEIEVMLTNNNIEYRVDRRKSSSATYAILVVTAIVLIYLFFSAFLRVNIVFFPIT